MTLKSSQCSVMKRKWSTFLRSFKSLLIATFLVLYYVSDCDGTYILLHQLSVCVTRYVGVLAVCDSLDVEWILAEWDISSIILYI